jgi:hypothetical protein
MAMSNCGVQLNRKETKHLLNIIDEDGDGELQFSEYMEFIGAVAKDEEKRQQKLKHIAWLQHQKKLKKRRKERKKKRIFLRQKMMMSLTELHGKNAKGEKVNNEDPKHSLQTGAVSLHKFVDGSALDDEESSDDSSDDEEDQDGLPLATVEDVVVEYLEDIEKSKQKLNETVVQAPMLKIVLASLNAFIKQEKENCGLLLKFYSKNVGTNNDLSLQDFTELIVKLTIKNIQSKEILQQEVS